LIIAANVGKTAPGIVFERLIQELCKTHEIDILTSDLDPLLDISAAKNIFEIKRKTFHHRIPKLLISLFGINPLDVFWSKNAVSKLVTAQHHYDLILSFISFHNYAPLIAGSLALDKLSSKLAVYSVDAIPAPIGWSVNDSYFRQVKNMMAKYLAKADFFFSANEQMLNYQLGTFKPKKKLVVDVVFNPNGGKLTDLQTDGMAEPYFLYTGGIYQVRKPDYILKAFEKLLIKYPSAKMVFVGTVLTPAALSLISQHTLDSIQFMPFAKDLNDYYKRATALIDIDADIENDVFLSSKMVSYLEINRVIISETGKNSPSRRLFSNIESIIQCDHDAGQLCDAMERSIKLNNKLSFQDRQLVLKEFSVETVVNKLNKILTDHS